MHKIVGIHFSHKKIPQSQVWTIHWNMKINEDCSCTKTLQRFTPICVRWSLLALCLFLFCFFWFFVLISIFHRCVKSQSVKPARTNEDKNEALYNTNEAMYKTNDAMYKTNESMYKTNEDKRNHVQDNWSHVQDKRRQPKPCTRQMKPCTRQMKTTKDKRSHVQYKTSLRSLFHNDDDTAAAKEKADVSHRRSLPRQPVLQELPHGFLKLIPGGIFSFSSSVCYVWGLLPRKHMAAHLLLRRYPWFLEIFLPMKMVKSSPFALAFKKTLS